MSKLNSNCVIFVGPSLAKSAVKTEKHIMFRPPVKRGDIETLISKRRRPAAIAIVDGQFHQCLSVGHAEIRSAIKLGWQVWGLSSMGAIRAYEMRHMGMLGFGRVYKCFSRYADFRDDEVALLHEASPPYRAFSEPLIHLREWFKDLRKIGLITRRQEKELIHTLMGLWFGERTLDHARSLVLSLLPGEEKSIDETLTDFDRYRIKTHDLEDFLEQQPWVAIESSQNFQNVGTQRSTAETCS